MSMMKGRGHSLSRRTRDVQDREPPSPGTTKRSGLDPHKAFGLNRSELFTRQGHSPSVKFPRILGIEAVGVVEKAPGNQFHKGDKVATAMGGMGREFDGSYAEYTCVPATQVQVLETELPWKTLGALVRFQRLPPGERLSLEWNLMTQSGQRTSVGIGSPLFRTDGFSGNRIRCLVADRSRSFLLVDGCRSGRTHRC